jgi:hypothetical protein
MCSDAYVLAYVAGLTDLLTEHTGGYQIQKADLLISEITDADGLLPMLMLLAHEEVCKATPGLAPIRLSYDKEALVDYKVAEVPTDTSLTRMLSSTGKLLRGLARGVQKSKPIMLDGVYQDWRALMLTDGARFTANPTM